MNTLTLQSDSVAGPPTRFVLSFGTFVVGRSSKCDVCVNDDTVSRRHAVVAVADTICLCDLGSRNGTFVEDTRVEKATVQIGQRVRFGSVAFLLVMGKTGNDDPGSEIETAKCALLKRPIDPFPGLSRAQRRVMALILEGLGEKHVATRLRISRTTVHNHIQAIYRVFKVHSRAELLVQLLTKGTSIS